MATTIPGGMQPTTPVLTQGQQDALYQSLFQALAAAKVQELKKIRKDLMTWRRGSAQLALRINPVLHNLSIYSVLVTDVAPSMELYRYLLGYNTLQRRESLGLLERDGRNYIVLKYTMELELAQEAAVQRHVFALQEIADALDTELAEQFGGKLHFDDWKKLDQKSVDNLLDNLFG
jgi:hypothetical protein